MCNAVIPFLTPSFVAPSALGPPRVLSLFWIHINIASHLRRIYFRVMRINQTRLPWCDELHLHPTTYCLAPPSLNSALRGRSSGSRLYSRPRGFLVPNIVVREYHYNTADRTAPPSLITGITDTTDPSSYCLVIDIHTPNIRRYLIRHPANPNVQPLVLTLPNYLRVLITQL